MIKNEHNFGTGHFIGDIMQPEADFFELPTEDQARYLGWVASCPVVEELIDPANAEPGRGAEAMVNRYAAVSFWHSYIVEQTRGENFGLTFKLRDRKDRRQDEPVGKYEPESVPEVYDEEYAPLAKLVNFAMPRLFIDHISSGDDKGVRIASATDIVRQAAKESKASPERFLAFAAEGFATNGTSPNTVLKRIAGQGWLEEHNGRHMFNTAMLQLREHAPTVWDVYESLTSEERTERGLAEFDPLSVEYEPTQEDLETIFEQLMAKTSESGKTRDADPIPVIARTDLLLHGSDAKYASGDDLVEHIEINFRDPIEKSNLGGGEEVHVSVYYGQPGLSANTYGALTYLMVKTVTYTRGLEYTISKLPLNLNVETMPLANPLPEDAEQEIQHDASSLIDLDDEYSDANHAITPDDIALLYRLTNRL